VGTQGDGGPRQRTEVQGRAGLNEDTWAGLSAYFTELGRPRGRASNATKGQKLRREEPRNTKTPRRCDTRCRKSRRLVVEMGLRQGLRGKRGGRSERKKKGGKTAKHGGNHVRRKTPGLTRGVKTDEPSSVRREDRGKGKGSGTKEI